MFELKAVNVTRAKVETLAIPVSQDGELHDDKAIQALVAAATATAEFSGKAGERLTLFAPEGTKVVRAVFFGIGKTESLTAETLRAMAGKAVKFCIQSGLTTVTVATPTAKATGLEAGVLFKALLEGGCLANHVFDRYKEKKEKQPIKKMVVMATAAQKKAHGKLADWVAAACHGSIMAREWVSIPANDKRPPAFATMIQKAAKAEGLKVKVMDDRWLAENKFGAMLAVGQGSQAKSRLVAVEHAPKGAKKTVVLVGKGVTFDSGGLNLKPSGSIETMKMDMGGAAAVAGAMLAVGRLKPNVRVIGVMPLVENMPSGTAIRPGDIVKSYLGKTIEINNTDAEGRLILVDALAWARKQYKPDTMIDLATLTGACVIALGEKIAGVFSKDQKLAEAIVDAGQAAHERCWQLPLPDDYLELLKNDFADLNNISGGRWGGAITAALFLSEFVGDTSWAHIDIAGPAWSKKASDYCGPGGTGFGVRLLCEYLESL